MINPETSPHLPFLPARPAGLWREVFEGDKTLLPECPMAGWAHFGRADASLPAHTHRGSYEICYIVRGSVEWWVGSQIYNVEPNDLFVTHPREAHGGVDAFMHPCELYWVHVRPRNALYEQLADVRRHFRGGPVIAAHFARLLAEHRLAEQAMAGKNLAACPVGAGAPSVAAARAALRLLVTDTLRFNADAEGGDRPATPTAQIAAAMQILGERFAFHNCLQEAARSAGLGGTQFRKRFQAETGFSPNEYQTRAQVAAAKRMLVHTELPITEIALELGFSSSQYFATVFRKLVGLTPQGYRARRASVV